MNGFILSVLLLTAFYFDHRQGKIPNPLTAGGVLAGLLLQFTMHGTDGLLQSAAGIAAGFLPLLLLYLFGALGAGDVKLFAAIGAIMGTEYVLGCMLYSILFSGLIGIGILSCKKLLFQRMVSVGTRLFTFIHFKDLSELKGIDKNGMLRFPFMYAVLPGFLAAMYLRMG